MDLDHIIQLYQSGVPLAEISRQTGHTYRTLRKRLNGMGITLRTQSEVARVEWGKRPEHSRRFTMAGAATSQRTERGNNIAAQYLAGQSVASLAREYGVQRRSIEGILHRRGIPSRTIDESLALTAKQRQYDLSLVGDGEDQLRQWLGEDFIPQLAVGPYNLDLACWPLAVEVTTTAGNMLKRPHLRRRVEYLRNLGWTVVYVMADHRTSGSLQWAVADHVLALLQKAQWNPPGRGQYWVLRGTGEHPPVSGDDLDHGAVMLPPASPYNRRPID